MKADRYKELRNDIVSKRNWDNNEIYVFNLGIDAADRNPKYPWKSNKEEPNTGRMILCHYFEDCSKYFVGEYIGNTKIKFFLPSEGICYLREISQWMYIPEINPYA